MTKGGNSKPKILGRLIFGEKRKQHASSSRHRSATRNGDNKVDVTSSGGGGDDDVANKNPINLHDWAAWRLQLNEQMGDGTTERADMKQMRQFLHGNSFYQQHSRDPSNGQYNGARLLFSIPHAKLNSELTDGSQGTLNKNTNIETADRTISDQNHVRLNNGNHTTKNISSVSTGSPMVTDKTSSYLLPKGLIGNTGDFLHINEQMIAADAAQTHRPIRTFNTATDRVHSTLQKAVKDGNVLEKIKAFEMQAAAAQSASTPKLGGSGINNRLQSAASSIQSATNRALSPAMIHPMRHPISPIMLQHDPHQQYIRSHRSRHVHPAQQHHRDGNFGPIISRESRKGAHVLEPAHGDIILKRRTPSQKTVNDEDHTITAMSSIAHTASQGHQHRQHHSHHRLSASHSRHRQEMVHDKRTSNHPEYIHKKHQQKPKETTASSSTKPSTRRRWLKGRKETPIEIVTENIKQDVLLIKSKKPTKTKKKNNEQEKFESTKKTTSDNNRVYGVPNAAVSEQTKFETTSSPQLPTRIDEENESDREEKNIENKNRCMSPKEDDITQSKECDTIVATPVERRPIKTKYYQKLSSTDGEILSKIDDDTRFSRPTDDHAHRSELNDEDDECKSEGDVFIEDSSVANINPHQQQSSNVTQHQCSTDELSSDRRWQWSKESGGLIDKGNRKKKQQQPITIVTRKNQINQDEVQVVYETSYSEQIQTSVCDTHTLKKKQSSQPITTTGSSNEIDNTKQVSKQILHAIMNSMNTNNQRQSTTDNFFETGPHTNPEETMINMTSSS